MTTGTKKIMYSFIYNPTLSDLNYELIAKEIYPVSTNPLCHKKIDKQSFNISVKKYKHISRHGQYYMKHTIVRIRKIV